MRNIIPPPKATRGIRDGGHGRRRSRSFWNFGVAAFADATTSENTWGPPLGAWLGGWRLAERLKGSKVDGLAS